MLTKFARSCWTVCVLGVSVLGQTTLTQSQAPLTVAESSDWKATATHADVLAFIEELRERPNLRVLELGKSHDGKSLPLLALSSPPVSNLKEAKASGKPILFAFGNIHAGEVCGKEALLMLAREWSSSEDHPLLKQAVILLAPIYNADGNDRMAPDNRPGQVGPEAGMGERPNSQGLDLNRDWCKLETPEARAMVSFLSEWDPLLTVDTHTTNGSQHRYSLTYSAPLCPSGDERGIAYIRDEFLPVVTRRLKQHTEHNSFYYGNFNREKTRWTTYSALPRFGGPYRGLRGQMSILSEAYAYASYRERVEVTREFVRLIFERAVEKASTQRLLALREKWRTQLRDSPPAEVGLRFEAALLGGPTDILGWEEVEDEDGRRKRTDQERTYKVAHYGRFSPTLSVQRPYAYAIPPELKHVADNLSRHGVELFELSEERSETVETYTVQSIKKAERPFQGHNLVELEVSELETSLRKLRPGTVIAHTHQPLGNLVVFLLEPQSEDGLVTWNFLDEALVEGSEYPIWRLDENTRLRRRK